MDFHKQIQKVIDNVEKVIYGKRQKIELVLASLLSEGHILLEDVPGVGKTILARSLAKSMTCSFKRIQFTPDLLPSDVTGVSIYNQKENDFEFKKGPIFSNIVLADEINRATPRTQSSLLESMAEEQITVEGETRGLPRPFHVIATQNPVEYEGTYPLPEAQMDRFLTRIKIGYPDLDDEIDILSSQQYKHPLKDLEPVISGEDFIDLQKKVKDIFIKPELKNYIVRIVKRTRNHSDIQLGVSPRGSLGIFRMAQAWALNKSRDYVIPDDIKLIAPFILQHRMKVKSQSRLKGRDSENIVHHILNDVPVSIS